MKLKLIIAIMGILVLTTGCQKEVKQYDHGKLVYEGTVDSKGMREEGKLYDPDTGKVIFDGLFRNNLMFKGTVYDKDGKNPHPYEE